MIVLLFFTLLFFVVVLFIFPINVLCIGVFHLGIGMFSNKIHCGPTISFFVGLFFLFEMIVLFCGASVLHANLCNDSVVHVVLALVFTHWSSTKCSSLWFYYCSSFLWWSL